MVYSVFLHVLEDYFVYNAVVEAVSYTHLDVYKRQLEMTPNMMMKTEIYVFAVPTAPTAWSLTDDSIRVSTMPDSL